MPVFEDLMKRLGFVKLRKFGLMLTDDGRVVSTRTEVLDDDGTPVVGWRDADLAAAQLPKWGAAKPQPAPIESRFSAQMKAAVPPPAAEEPEEDWEWHIALARARAAAEEADKAAQSLVRPVAPLQTAPGRKDPNETQRGHNKTQPKRAEQMPIAKPRLALVKSEPAAPPLAKPTLALVRDTTAVTPPPKPERAKRQDDIATARSAPATSPTSPMRAVTKTSPMITAVTPAAIAKPARAPSPEVVAKRTERFDTQEPDIIEETAFAQDQTVVGIGVGEKTDVIARSGSAGPRSNAERCGESIDNARTTGRQRIARGTPDPQASEDNTQVTLAPKPTKTALPSITQQMARR